ncbi:MULTISPECIES: hypothetical protein [Bacillaceae]|uniref:Uncharacterized protein n=1 Tax=Evansella alkalicola TaxID=745819 RepID=A0ABS6JZY4_9BACI|nr:MULTISPECIES: hypothetical protein [Bacillaceae]MBU9723772.1 hypothetical protein [Bacillus alkalicola]
MVYVEIDQIRKRFVVHENETCQKVTKSRIVSKKYRDIQRAKFAYLNEYCDYTLIHHCQSAKVRNVASNGASDAPFNDYIRFHQNVYGPIGKRVNISALPKWIRIFFYFVMSVIIIGTIIILIYS